MGRMEGLEEEERGYRKAGRTGETWEEQRQATFTVEVWPDRSSHGGLNTALACIFVTPPCSCLHLCDNSP